MYRVAAEKSKGNSKMEPVALCNYGIFLFSHRKQTERALEILQDGLSRFNLRGIALNIILYLLL